jgi:aspartate aminotransferase-like enzyme
MSADAADTARTAATLFHKPRLMTPGPTDVPAAVLEEMARFITSPPEAMTAERSSKTTATGNCF